MTQNNQELQRLYSELINRMKQGVEMHEQLADYYGFLNLPGYQKCHDYQMLCELLTYRKAKDAYMREYNQLVQPMENMGLNNSNMTNNKNPQNYAEVIPQNWYSHTRYDVDAGTKRSAVRDGFKKWLTYETETKEFLTKMAQHLEEINEREAARKLDYLIDHVEKEIEHAEEKILSLENVNYDMNYILQEQDSLKQKYADKIRDLNMRDYQYRRRGMGNYANYNNDDDDDEEYYERRMRPTMRYYRRY